MTATTLTIQSLKKISLAFFLATGFLHLGAFALMTNNLFLKQAIILNKTMDIPFIITGLLYGFSALRLAFLDPEKEHKTFDFSLLSIIGLVLIALVLINVLTPNFN